jgi:hypothetical protein
MESTTALPLTPPPTRSPRGWWIAPVAITCIFLAGVLPLILRGHAAGRGSDDEQTSHLPTIRTFAAEWPRPDLHDYRSATTPGYHLALAAVDRWVGDDVRLLRLSALVFSIGLLLTLTLWTARRVDPATAVALCLPVAASVYVISSAVWLLPDNAGWWGVLALMLIAWRPRVDWRTWVLGGLVLLALVFFRQVHAWAAGLLVIAAWLGSADNGPSDRSRIRRLTAAVLAVLPAVLLLAYFAHLWHGLTPPTYQAGKQVHVGGNPAVPAMVLAVTGAWGIFYCGFLFPHRSVLAKRWPLVALGAGLAALVAVAPHTSYDKAAGRWSGFWNVAQHLPTFADRSPLVIALACLGGAILAAWAVVLPRRDRWLFLAAWAGFTVAQAANREAWQRYYEPFVLILFAIAVVRLSMTDAASSQAPAARHRWPDIGPLLLACLLAAISIAALR